MVETVHDTFIVIISHPFTYVEAEYILRNAMRYQPHTWDRNHHVAEQGRWLVRVYEWCIHRYVVRVYHRIEQTHISPLIEQRRIHSTSTPQARTLQESKLLSITAITPSNSAAMAEVCPGALQKHPPLAVPVSTNR